MDCGGSIYSDTVQTGREYFYYFYPVPLGLFNYCTLTISGLSSNYSAPKLTIKIKINGFPSPFVPNLEIIPEDQKIKYVYKSVKEISGTLWYPLSPFVVSNS